MDQIRKVGTSLHFSEEDAGWVDSGQGCRAHAFAEGSEGWGHQPEEVADAPEKAEEGA